MPSLVQHGAFGDSSRGPLPAIPKFREEPISLRVRTPVARPDDNHSATPIEAAELRRNRGRTGVDFDGAQVLGRWQEIEIEWSRQRHIVEIHRHRTSAEARVRSL